MSKLLPGENLVLKAHPHWITIVRSLLLPVALFLLIALADFSVLNPDNFYVPKLRTILWFIVVWIRWQSTTYTLTDQRIKIERGIFSRQEKLIAVDRVQDVSTRQSILGRVLGYGNVQIESAGEVGSEVFSSLPEPEKFRDQVFIQSEARRGAPAPAAAPSPVAANPSGV
jgi:uncharacterized membrane protein YdbT with pleckstrin-like domain